MCTALQYDTVPELPVHGSLVKYSALLYNAVPVLLYTAKKPCRDFSDSDVDNGCNRLIYHRVENFSYPLIDWSVTSVVNVGM